MYFSVTGVQHILHRQRVCIQHIVLQKTLLTIMLLFCFVYLKQYFFCFEHVTMWGPIKVFLNRNQRVVAAQSVRTGLRSAMGRLKFDNHPFIGSEVYCGKWACSAN